MPAAAIRDSRWVKNGSPAVGSIGLGADSVSGRSRVPCPPTRMTASTAAGLTGFPKLVPSFRVAPAPPDHQARPRLERTSHRQQQRRLPPLAVSISQKSVGAPVVSGQVAGGI